MENELLARIEKLERELDLYKRHIIITPTKVIIKQSVLINGLVHGDRIYTKKSGVYAQL